MGFNSSGTYTPATGATTAAAGNVIASATWNSIHTDLSTALTTLGAVSANSIVGNNTGSTATAASLSVANVQKLLNTNTYTVSAVAVSLSVTADTQMTVTLPTGITNYAITSLRLANFQGTSTSATVGLYTAANQGGTTIITSTALTVASSLANATNSSQVIIPASANTVMFNASPLFFCVVHNNGGVANSSTDAIVTIQPLY